MNDKALCNEGCLKVFRVHFQTKQYPSGLQETYFECSHCHHHYTSFVTDKRVRDMHRQIRIIQGKAKRTQRDNQSILKLDKQVRDRMKLLKEEFLHATT